eukprot:TRINITY_DN4516_c0_g1_i1.p1 TRINITY_DN4516_c0_g1~~TRINITY_DN4516_c0_g1_i1.p1  ORF type:complete len:214 (-),score=15.03 TRINITY_DN4516_c0_g1_i1:376-1017(-)
MFHSFTTFIFLATLICGVSSQSSQAVASAQSSSSGGATVATARSITSTGATPAPTVQESCPSACNDNPPPPAKGEQQYTCQQQKDWDKCDADFMAGYCECTCGRCCACNNFPPTGHDFTCKQQKDFGKCGFDFMKGYCECTCGRCTSDGSSLVSFGGCSGGQFPIYGTDKCETKRCAENRQRCADRCGSLSKIDFDCMDTGAAFSSSCACAGR